MMFVHKKFPTTQHKKMRIPSNATSRHYFACRQPLKKIAAWLIGLYNSRWLARGLIDLLTAWFWSGREKTTRRRRAAICRRPTSNMRGGMLVATARKKEHLKEGRAAGCTPPPR